MLVLGAGGTRADDFVRVHPGPGADLDDRPRRGQREVLAKRDAFVDMVAGEALLRELAARGYRVELLQPAIDVALAELKRPDAGFYHRHHELVAELEGWARTHPGLVRLVRLGTGAELAPDGRPREILAARISSSREPRPATLVFGGIHARELGTVEVPLVIGRRLLARVGTDPELAGLLARREIWLLPSLNPDGREHCFAVDPWWRKNRAVHEAPHVGVDLNRNFGYRWGPNPPRGGSSGHPGSGIYRGPGPFSEPETRALRRLVTEHAFASSLSLHSYGNLILVPFGFGGEEPRHPVLFERLSRTLHELTGYEVGRVSEVLGYYSNGRHDDWLYAGVDEGKAMIAAIELEIGRSFFPTAREVDELATLLEPAVVEMARLAGPVLDLTASLEVDAGGATRLEARVENRGIGAARDVVLEIDGTRNRLGTLPGLAEPGEAEPAAAELTVPVGKGPRSFRVLARAAGEPAVEKELMLPAVD